MARVPDELARWASDRAPQLLERAESEAVAVLRDALLRAAIGDRHTPAHDPAARDPAPDPAIPARPRGRPEPGELVWAYCVLGEEDPHPAELEPLPGAGPVERVQAAGLAALVSWVPRAQFGPDPLRRNLNDLGWLERTARAHESVLERTMAGSTIVPLRMCTLFETSQGVARMLERDRDRLSDALEALAGRQEWGVKVLVDAQRLTEQARARCDDASALERDLESRGAGGAYMLRRRVERQVRDLTDALATEVADQVHARLQDWAIGAVTRPPQNRDLSAHEGEMLLNAAYLVHADRVGELTQLVSELEERYEVLGARIELTGPWPPYNFIPDADLP